MSVCNSGARFGFHTGCICYWFTPCYLLGFTRSAKLFVGLLRWASIRDSWKVNVMRNLPASPIHTSSFATVSLLLLLQTLWTTNTSGCGFHYSLHSSSQLRAANLPLSFERVTLPGTSSRALANRSKQIAPSAIHSGSKSDCRTGHWTFQFLKHRNYWKYVVTEHQYRTRLSLSLC